MVKTINWNGHDFITFEYEVNNELQWVFLGRQVVEALEYKGVPSDIINGKKNSKGQWNPAPKVNEANKIILKAKELNSILNVGDSPILEISRKGEIIITELGVYELIMKSDMPLALEFQRWVFNTLKQLREKAGLEQYQAFRMMDKDVQKSVNKIIAEVGDLSNDMTNNIVGNQKVNLILSQELWGFDNAVTKPEMEKHCKEMLIDRQEVLKKYADYLISCDGSHTKAEECTRKWVRFRYGHIISQRAV